MIYLPIELLKPGMVVARAVESYSDSFSLPLLNKGQILTDSIIRRLVSRNIHGCFIDTDFTKDIEPGCIIAPALKEDNFGSEKSSMRYWSKKVSKESMRLVLEISEELVLQILRTKSCLSILSIYRIMITTPIGIHCRLRYSVSLLGTSSNTVRHF